MPELYVPGYLLQAEKKDDPIRKSDYSQCSACKEYCLVAEMERHRRIWCDPEHKRKKQMTMRSTISPNRIVGGFVLGTGVSIKPIENPPKQTCPYWCSRCTYAANTLEGWRMHSCNSGVKV